MKFSHVALAIATAGSLVAAQPHNHKHRHIAKRAPDTVTVTGPVVTVYELNGKPISEVDVQKGIADGSLVWADGGQPSLAPLPSTSTSVRPSTSIAVAQFYQQTPSSSSTSSTSFSTSASSTSSSTAQPSSSTSTSTSSQSSAAPAAYSSTPSSDGGSAGLDKAFPDGQIACSQFPSEYGPIALNYLKLGGWSGIQQTGSSNSGGSFSYISTATAGQTCANDGDYCSYACPPGYQKSQWPAAQGAKGESVGGLLCSGGKLHLTNAALSNKLCMKGADDTLKVNVKNSLSQNVAICRTDYPGTESEVIPINTLPGEKKPITCPDANNYYQWTGKPTSAQYYVNQPGVSQEDACWWSTPGGDQGNYAPLNLGVGTKDGLTWLSIIPNAPTTTALFKGTVELVGDFGTSTCKYSNGQYYQDGNVHAGGCTVQLRSGQATYLIS
ncbi:MAG: hypothetical protein M1829_004117 [Trizodia sp. TS-e1964]|nr:MAG: hypothetical protein M1829_004117 [Trizodia sp. TS-e1964]